MDALGVLAECEARGVRLEVAGTTLRITGPTRVVAHLHPTIAARKRELLALLRHDADDGGCARCGVPQLTHRSTDGTGWCQRCDWRRYLLDLAALAGYPSMRLSPTLYVIKPGGASWNEFARCVSGGTLYVALRLLRVDVGARSGAVPHAVSPIEAWAS